MQNGNGHSIQYLLVTDGRLVTRDGLGRSEIGFSDIPGGLLEIADAEVILAQELFPDGRLEITVLKSRFSEPGKKFVMEGHDG